jgi:DNA-binding transcriptional MerR regulator
MMTKNTLAMYSQSREVLYSPASTCKFARVSLEFLQECEREGLIRPQIMVHGEQGFSIREIRQLARIRRLRDTLAVDLAAVEIILNLRQQVLDVIKQLDRLEERTNVREQELLNEIQTLRFRLAEELDWTDDME